MYRIALCDDDNNFLKSLEKTLESYFSLYSFGAKFEKFSDGKTLIESIEKKKMVFDVIFLDIHMPGLNGFLTAERLRELNESFILIFTTNMYAQATEGYKYDAFRYILKHRLESDVEEAVRKIIEKTKDTLGREETVTFKTRNNGVFESITVNKGDILFFHVDSRKRVCLKTIHAEYDLLTNPLVEYKQMLEGENFAIILRSYLVNLDGVEDIDKQYFVMRDGTKISLGYSKKARKISLKKYMLYTNERVGFSGLLLDVY